MRTLHSLMLGVFFVLTITPVFCVSSREVTSRSGGASVIESGVTDPQENVYVANRAAINSARAQSNVRGSSTTRTTNNARRDSAAPKREVTGRTSQTRTTDAGGRATQSRTVNAAGRATQSRTVRTANARTPAPKARNASTQVRTASNTRAARSATNVIAASHGATKNAVKSRTATAGKSRATSNTITRARTTSATALINSDVAAMTEQCKVQYTQCMDNFCNVLDDAQGRCSCSKNIKNYAKTSTAQKEANAALQDIAQQIQYIGLSRDEVETLFKQTEAELTMQGSSDNSQIKNSLDKIKDMIIDVKPATAANTEADTGLSFNLDGLLDFNLDSMGFDLSAMFGGNNSNTSSISNQRGEQLYKTASARCKKTVLDTCQAQGINTTLIANTYDMEIDRACIAYERSLSDGNDDIVQTVRNAQSVLQRARLMVEQQKNLYDLRGCVGALDACMQDEFVCGSDYELCLDPTGKYIVEGSVVVGSTPGYIIETASNVSPSAVYDSRALMGTWYYDDKYAWGATKQDGTLVDYIKKYVTNKPITNTSSIMAEYLQYKIGYNDNGKNYGMCMSVLNKCKKLTYNSKTGDYIPNNQVITEYLSRTLVRIKHAQDEILADYAEGCITDVSSCLSTNGFDTESNSKQNIAINACRAQIKTCMSVHGNSASDPDPISMRNWVLAMVGALPDDHDPSGGNQSGSSIKDLYTQTNPSSPMAIKTELVDKSTGTKIAVYEDTQTDACYANPAQSNGSYSSAADAACVVDCDISSAGNTICNEDNTVILTASDASAMSTYARRKGVSLTFNGLDTASIKIALENGQLPSSLAWVRDLAKDTDYRFDGVVSADGTEYYNQLGNRVRSSIDAGSSLTAIYAYDAFKGACRESGGSWQDESCSCAATGTIYDEETAACVCDVANNFTGTPTMMGCQCATEYEYDSTSGTCIKSKTPDQPEPDQPEPDQPSAEQTACENQGGNWKSNKCNCGEGKQWWQNICMSQAQFNCVTTHGADSSGNGVTGVWENGACTCPGVLVWYNDDCMSPDDAECLRDGFALDSNSQCNKCPGTTDLVYYDTESKMCIAITDDAWWCERLGGTMKNGKCETWNKTYWRSGSNEDCRDSVAESIQHLNSVHTASLDIYNINLCKCSMNTNYYTSGQLGADGKCGCLETFVKDPKYNYANQQVCTCEAGSVLLEESFGITNVGNSHAEDIYVEYYGESVDAMAAYNNTLIDLPVVSSASFYAKQLGRNVTLRDWFIKDKNGQVVTFPCNLLKWNGLDNRYHCNSVCMETQELQNICQISGGQWNSADAECEQCQGQGRTPGGINDLFIHGGKKTLCACNVTYMWEADPNKSNSCRCPTYVSRLTGTSGVQLQPMTAEDMYSGLDWDADETVVWDGVDKCVLPGTLIVHADPAEANTGHADYYWACDTKHGFEEGTSPNHGDSITPSGSGDYWNLFNVFLSWRDMNSNNVQELAPACQCKAGLTQIYDTTLQKHVCVADETVYRNCTAVYDFVQQECKCSNSNMIWNGTACVSTGGTTPDQPEPEQPSAEQTACTNAGGTWKGTTCDCVGGKEWNGTSCDCGADKEWNGAACVSTIGQSGAAHEYCSANAGSVDGVIKSMNVRGYRLGAEYSSYPGAEFIGFVSLGSNAKPSKASECGYAFRDKATWYNNNICYVVSDGMKIGVADCNQALSGHIKNALFINIDGLRDKTSRVPTIEIARQHPGDFNIVVSGANGNFPSIASLINHKIAFSQDDGMKETFYTDDEFKFMGVFRYQDGNGAQFYDADGRPTQLLNSFHQEHPAYVDAYDNHTLYAYWNDLSDTSVKGGADYDMSLCNTYHETYCPCYNDDMFLTDADCSLNFKKHGYIVGGSTGLAACAAQSNGQIEQKALKSLYWSNPQTVTTGRNINSFWYPWQCAVTAVERVDEGTGQCYLFKSSNGTKSSYNSTTNVGDDLIANISEYNKQILVDSSYCDTSNRAKSVPFTKVMHIISNESMWIAGEYTSYLDVAIPDAVGQYPASLAEFVRREQDTNIHAYMHGVFENSDFSGIQYYDANGNWIDNEATRNKLQSLRSGNTLDGYMWWSDLWDKKEFISATSETDCISKRGEFLSPDRCYCDGAKNLKANKAKNKCICKDINDSAEQLSSMIYENGQCSCRNNLGLAYNLAGYFECSISNGFRAAANATQSAEEVCIAGNGIFFPSIRHPQNNCLCKDGYKAEYPSTICEPVIDEPAVDMQQICTDNNGVWTAINSCTCPADGYAWDSTQQKCVQHQNLDRARQCVQSGGTWFEYNESGITRKEHCDCLNNSIDPDATWLLSNGTCGLFTLADITYYCTESYYDETLDAEACRFKDVMDYDTIQWVVGRADLSDPAIDNYSKLCDDRMGEYRFYESGNQYIGLCKCSTDIPNATGTIDTEGKCECKPGYIRVWSPDDRHIRCLAEN